MPPVTGINLIVQVENSGMPGTYRTIGGQRGARLRRSLSTADAKAKDTGASEVHFPLFKGYRIEADHLLIEDDAAYLDLEDAYENRAFVNVRVQMPNADTYTGSALVTQADLEGPHDDMATVSVVLTISNGLTKA